MGGACDIKVRYWSNQQRISATICSKSLLNKEGWLVKQDEDDMRISTAMKDGFHCAIGESVRVRAAKLFPAKEIQDAPFSEAATMPNSNVLWMWLRVSVAEVMVIWSPADLQNGITYGNAPRAAGLKEATPNQRISKVGGRTTERPDLAQKNSCDHPPEVDTLFPWKRRCAKGINWMRAHLFFVCRQNVVIYSHFPLSKASS